MLNVSLLSLNEVPQIFHSNEKNSNNISGELRKETHNAPLMEDGKAYFAEKLAVPAVLYYDKRKKLFLPKEVKYESQER